MNLIIGNVVALLASIAMTLSGLFKNKKQIIFMQIIQVALAVISNLVLGGYVGAIVNFINLIRNIICYKDKLDIKGIIIITILSSGLSLYFNNLGIVGLFPLVASTVYLWFMNIKEVTKFKVMIILTTILWLIYDIFIRSYTAALFDAATIITNFFTVYILLRRKIK